MEACKIHPILNKALVTFVQPVEKAKPVGRQLRPVTYRNIAINVDTARELLELADEIDSITEKLQQLTTEFRRKYRFMVLK